MEKRKVIGLCISFLIIGIIIGSISIVIAESINSNEVLYDNSNSSSSATDVQGAIDDVYNTLDKVGSGYSLIAHAPEGLSTELVAGLYRYQGVQDASHNVNNYICFGTVNKSTCVGDTDKYMYRIIGINTNGQMKLIKKEALNTAYVWNSEYGVEWVDSELKSNLNSSEFLTNITYIPDVTWSNRISLTDWHYTTLDNISVDADLMYENEMSSSMTTNAKIGLIYLHDYYYALSGGNNCGTSTGASICKSSWIYLPRNDSNPPNTYYEWTMMRRNWAVPLRINLDSSSPSGRVDNGDMKSSHSVRPVFFLNSSERIASGSGTITDPYILS